MSETPDPGSDTTDGFDVEIDVREIAGEPFGPIVAALEDLDRDERLLLVNSFEPEPLYDVLAERGFAFETTRASDDEWRVVIEHG